MKPIAAIAGPLLLLAAACISRFEAPVDDFLKGMLLGLSAVGSCYTIVQFGMRKKSKVV